VDSAAPDGRLSRVSPDARHLAFTSQSAALAQQVAGYDNADAATGEPDSEVYLYDADADRLVCASCNPSGARPQGEKVGGAEEPVAARIRGWQWSNLASRNLSDDGQRLFFESYDPLVPADTNGVLDVYEWRAPGTGPAGGRCTAASPSFSARNGGCLDLLSTGKSQGPSRFLDASADGSDAFISTDSSLVPQDPGLVDVYDARVLGGYPPPPGEASPCVGDACQSVPAAPAYQAPPTAAPAGNGNVAAARAGCAAPARRARKLSGRAKRLRRHSKRAGATKKAKQMRRRSTRLSKRARGASKRAKRCRRQRRAR
jgi:hypothetical protein